MDRPASAGPAVGRRDRTDRASSSKVVGRLGKAQPTCATRAGCAAKDCEGPTDVAGIATVRRAGTRCGRVIPRMGPSPGIEGVGCPTLLYRFGYDENFAPPWKLGCKRGGASVHVRNASLPIARSDLTGIICRDVSQIARRKRESPRGEAGWLLSNHARSRCRRRLSRHTGCGKKQVGRQGCQHRWADAAHE